MPAAVGVSGAVDYTIVNGRIIVEEGKLVGTDEEELFETSHMKIKEYLNLS